MSVLLPFTLNQAQGHGLVQTLIWQPLSASVTSTSSWEYVADYTYHAIQYNLGGGTGTLTVQSSIDGNTWFIDYTTTSSSFTTLQGRRAFFNFSCSLGSNASASVYLISGN